MMAGAGLRVFVSAGEVSGDAILGSVLARLRARYPRMELRGLGGAAAAACGLDPMLPLERTAVSGAWDVLRGAWFMLRMFRMTSAALGEFRPHLVLLVDYPGLNLRLARRACALGFAVQFIAPPQTWAYRLPGKKTRRAAAALAGCSVHVLFPFEAAAFAASAGRVTAGHFLVTDPLARDGASGGEGCLCLCPGSRLPVLRRNLPAWLAALEGIGMLGKGPVRVLVPAHLETEAGRILENFRGGNYASAILIRTDKARAFAEARCAVAFPGTIALELALHRLPTLVLAVLDPLTLAIGKRVLGSSRLALPNLLLKEDLFSEWAGIAANLTTERMRDWVGAIWAWDRPWEPVLRRLEAVIGKGGGAAIVADACAILLETPPNKAEIR